MGKMTREQVLALILQENPQARTDDVELYTSQFLTYCEAADNIARNGAIVAHPRTAAPMDNPYLRVRTEAMAAMQKIARLRKLNLLWKAFQQLQDEPPANTPAPKPETKAHKRRR